jgi:hypothetical protein
MNILFTLRKLQNEPTKAIIYVRVTENSLRYSWSLEIQVAVNQWLQDKQRIKGYTKEAEAINEFLNGYNFMILRNYGQLLTTGQEINIESLKNGIKIQKLDQITICKVLEHFKNKRLESHQLQHETKRTTLTRTSTLLKYLKKHNHLSVTPENIDDQFLEKFRENLLKERYKPIYINRLVKYLKASIREAYSDKLIKSMPFYTGKGLAEKEKEIIYLTSEELFRLANFSYLDEKLEVVRDLWLFQCYTAMAYIDLKNFTPEKNILNIDGNRMLCYERKKTGKKIQIPVFPQVDELLAKYNYRLPKRSNQRMNLHIKEACRLAGITKIITCHVARKTAATLWMELNIPALTVSSMMGHSDIKMTMKHYAKITNKKIVNDTHMLMYKKGA